MKIFTSDDIRVIERKTIEKDGINSRDIIKRMGRGAAEVVTSRWRPTRPMLVFAGPGTNGAYALATASILAERGYKLTIFLFNIGGNLLSRDCRAIRDELQAQNPDIDLLEITKRFDFPKITPQQVVIDGLFGSEQKEPLAMGFVQLVRSINESGAQIVALDIPSGLIGDINPATINRDVIHATITLAVQFPRIPFFISDNAELIGEWQCIDVGLNAEVIREMKSNFHLVEGSEVRDLIRPRKPFSTKADYGSALLIGGSYGMMGAATLMVRGALRAGAGKVTVHAPQCGYEVLQSSVAEAMFSPDSNKLVVSEIKPDDRFNAIGIGCGMGTNDLTVNALELFLKTRTKPVILDADAINCIAKRPSLLKEVPVLSVLTPHAGEFDRLFGEHHSDSSRILKAIEVAHKNQILILLKSHYTALIRPDLMVYFNSSGTPGMATGGAGDVLTGIITGLMAQGYKPEVSALLGAFIHGVAGEIATSQHGEMSVIAGDIAANIGVAIQRISARPVENQWTR